MSNVYEKLVDYAEVLVNIINKKYISGNSSAYLALLSGVGNCRVESFTGVGHNYQAVVDAIHNYYGKNEQSKANQGFQDGIYAMMRVTSNFVVVQNVVNILFYQLRKEKEGDAKFEIDSEQIFHELSNVIAKNRIAYKNESVSFDDWLERNSKYAFDNFGLKLG